MYLKSLTVIALVVGVVSPAIAGAVLDETSGAVAIRGSRGYVAAPQGGALADGTRILVKGKEATLHFDDGCTVTLHKGQVFTIEQISPCARQAAEHPATTSPTTPIGPEAGLSPFAIGGGLLLAGGVTAGVVLATQHHGGNGFWLPPTLSH